MRANNEYIDQDIKLHDGRRLAYHNLGIPSGQPVFYFHGWPSSRQEWRAVLS
jgi:pimeloyl-ACP methyl ester carboxylesterase